MRTIAPNHYTVFPSEIKTKTQEMNLPEYDQELITDLSNIWSGGEYASREYIDKNTPWRDPEFDTTKGFKVPGGNYTKSLSDAKDQWHLKDVSDHYMMQDFIKEMVQVDVPGSTPLEQAINTIKLLGDKEVTKRNMKRIVEEIKDKLEVSKDMDTIDEEITGTNNLDDVDKAAKLDHSWTEIMRVSAAMNKISALGTKPTPTLVKQVGGSIVKQRPITGFDEFHKINSRELILPRQVLNSRIIEGECQVNETYDKLHKIPFVNLIVDNSGSMQGRNQYRAMGIIYNLVKRAYAGECWLNFSFFEEHCHKFYFLPFDYPDIKSFFNDVIKSEGFNKGNTYVGDCIVEALNQADTIAAEHPNQISAKDKHLVVVNDGADDASNITLSMLKGAKLHSFILDSENADLRRISLQSGGTYREKI